MISRLPSLGLALALAVGCAAPKPQPTFPVGFADVYIISHGWHTGIALSKEGIKPDLAFLARHLGESPFYEIGWGDRGFYQAEKITPWLTAQAILWPTPTVMHVVAVPEAPEKYFSDSEVVKLRLPRHVVAALRSEIDRSFRRDEDGQTVARRNGIYGKSLFFDAEGRYFAVNTCNTWTARVLRRAGLPVRSFMTLRAKGVMRQTRKLAACRCGDPSAEIPSGQGPADGAEASSL